MPSSKDPRVTLVVTQRERMALTERSLENILADQAEPFRLIYVDGGAPPAIRAYLERRANEVGFKLIRTSGTLWPNAARNLALPFVDTEYVCFIDNDVLVEPGYLKKLVACADETGAGIVGPLYIIAGGKVEPRIHMAGGETTIVETPKGRALHERHVLMDAPLTERATLERAPCDYAEFHCMLVRTDLARGRIRDEMLNIHEHVELALEAKALGLPVMLEPSVAVTNLAFEPYRLDDLAFFRQRWSTDAARDTISAFCKKWNFADDGEAFVGVFQFLERIVRAVDPVWHRPPAGEAQRPAEATDIQQNLYGLLTQAAARGYPKQDLARFSQAYYAAMTLFDGGYRACGRPFITHCVGTASALVHFGFAPHLVIAALLHAAYSHSVLGKNPHAALEFLQNQISTTFGDQVAKTIRAYARLQIARDKWPAAHPVETMMVDDAEIVALDIANEIDLWASGEAHFTVSTAPPTPAHRQYYQAVAAGLGVPAMGDTLMRLLQTPPPADFDMRRAQKGSYRLAKGTIAPMAHGAFADWDKGEMAVVMRSA